MSFLTEELQVAEQNVEVGAASTHFFWFLYFFSCCSFQFRPQECLAHDSGDCDRAHLWRQQEPLEWLISALLQLEWLKLGHWGPGARLSAQGAHCAWRLCGAQPVNCRHLCLHFASPPGSVGWAGSGALKLIKELLREKLLDHPYDEWLKRNQEKLSFSLASSTNTNVHSVPDICVCSKKSPRKEALAFFHLEVMKKAWELSLLFP